MNDVPAADRTVSERGTFGDVARRLGRRTAIVPPANLAALTRQRIQVRLIREVEAMALFAMAAGIGVPPEVAVSVDRALSDLGGDIPAPGAPPDAVEQVALLANLHQDLIKMVTPARPGSLVMLIDERRNHPFWHSFGAVPLVRQMLGLAVLSLMLMLGISLSREVNADNMTKGLLALQGSELLVNEIFLVAASGVGATLANLKRLDYYISRCTYDRRYDSSYWTRLVMGLISGVVLSQVVYGALINPATTSTAGNANALSLIGQPLLALLGGFSAELVHDILTHFISVIRNAFGAGTPAPPAADLTAGKSDRPGTI